MPYKHQSECYRTIKGIKYINYSDLGNNDTHNKQTINRAQNLYKSVRIIQTSYGLKQVFVAKPKFEIME